MAGLWLVAVVVAVAAQAQPSPALSVSRSAGAEDCPDAQQLLAGVAAVRRLAAQPDRLHYRVAFSRDASGVNAEISTAGGATRMLRDASPACDALARATAVTVALLFDAAAEPPRATTPEVVGPPVPAAGTPVPAGDPESQGERVHAAVALGAGALVGVTAPVNAAAVLELGVSAGRLRGGLGALLALPRAVDLDPGSVREQLLSGSLHACFAPYLVELWRIDTCAAAWLGALHASAEGFERNDGATRLWSAIGLDLRAALASRPVGFELAASLLVPLRRQDFAIERAGVAYASRSLSLLFTLRASVGWDSSRGVPKAGLASQGG
jgi:hypothetical protein